jgi:hypothetical protein
MMAIIGWLAIAFLGAIGLILLVGWMLGLLSWGGE